MCCLSGCKTAAQYWIKILHLWAQDSFSSVGAGVWRNSSGAFPDSNSVLDKCLSARPLPGPSDPECPEGHKEPEVLLQTPKPRKIQRHEKVTQK